MTEPYLQSGKGCPLPYTVGRTLATSPEFPRGVPCILVHGDSVYATFPSAAGMENAQRVAGLLNAD